MIPLEEIFTAIDDFCKFFEAETQKIFLPRLKRKSFKCQMHLSEIVMIEVMFHFSHYRTFKDFYKDSILRQHKKDFPKALSYMRFVEVKKYALLPKATGRYFVDSTKLEVCHNLRIGGYARFNWGSVSKISQKMKK